jgi:hypothetical protein
MKAEMEAFKEDTAERECSQEDTAYMIRRDDKE